jgi:glycosyltransferase involved in cell wall biosynthesis
MSDPAFTILLPVTRPPDLMGFAIRSVLDQTREDLELFIVCDGAPPETVAAAEDAAARDARVRVFPFPKGERHGEAHRHAALRHARGGMVCQIADDDLWFPDHLAEIALLLKEVEFGNTLHAWVGPDDQCTAEFVDLADAAISRHMLSEPYNVFGPTVSGYRLATYRRLPVGWSPAPPNIWTDLAMWRKFLALPGIVVGSRFAVTAVQFPLSRRQDWSVEQRRAELARYVELAGSAQWRDSFRQEIMRRLARHRVAIETSLAWAKVETEAKAVELAASKAAVDALNLKIEELVAATTRVGVEKPVE